MKAHRTLQGTSEQQMFRRVKSAQNYKIAKLNVENVVIDRTLLLQLEYRFHFQIKRERLT